MKNSFKNSNQKSLLSKIKNLRHQFCVLKLEPIVSAKQVLPPHAADMSAETVALGPLAPDQCPSCTRTHTCVGRSSPVAEDSADTPLAQSTLRQAPQVLHQIPVYEIDNGEGSRACIRKGLIITIIVLIICILLVIILRSIF